MHKKCSDGLIASKHLTVKQKNTCILCRQQTPKTGSKEWIETISKFVKQRKAWAQYMLAHLYRTGEGVEQSDQQATELYKMAAKQGDATAQYNMGILYATGQGVNQSAEKAREWWMKAARQGHETSLFIFRDFDKVTGRRKNNTIFHCNTH